jgi:hypothetical protein
LRVLETTKELMRWVTRITFLELLRFEEEHDFFAYDPCYQSDQAPFLNGLLMQASAEMVRCEYVSPLLT